MAITMCCVASLFAQGSMNAYNYSRTDIKGTARYMGMGGAFGALGGDISTLSQNPAGIGVYRSNEIVTTLCYPLSIPGLLSLTAFFCPLSMPGERLSHLPG